MWELDKMKEEHEIIWHCPECGWTGPEEEADRHMYQYNPETKKMEYVGPVDPQPPDPFIGDKTFLDCPVCPKRSPRLKTNCRECDVETSVISDDGRCNRCLSKELDYWRKKAMEKENA